MLNCMFEYQQRKFIQEICPSRLKSDKMSNSIKIRKYRPDDYDQVAHFYQAGIKEVNSKAYQSFYNGLFPQLLMNEFIVFFAGYFIGVYYLNLGYFRSSILGVLSLFFLFIISMWIRFSWTKSYIRYVMGNDFKNTNLTFWTTEPNAFYVATHSSNERRILGFVACSNTRLFNEKAPNTTLEFGRLTVVPEARNLGVGKMLVMKVVEHARDFGCHTIVCTTWTTMYAANNLYKKLGFKIVSHIIPRQFKLFGCIPCHYFYPIIGERIPEFRLELD